jgi:hypothetical protein
MSAARSIVERWVWGTWLGMVEDDEKAKKNAGPGLGPALLKTHLQGEAN